MEYTNIINEIKLPNFLTSTEVNYYFKQFKEGNVKAREVLIYHNIKLVYWYIKLNIRCDYWDFDEVFSLGMEALIEAIDSFDIDRGVNISTYITTCVRNKVLKYFRDEEKYKKIISLDMLISDSHNAIEYEDRIVDDGVNLEEDIIEKDLVEYVKNVVNDLLQYLDEIDRTIIEMYFGFFDGKIYVQREIAMVLGISQSRVSKRLTSLLKRIRMEVNLTKENNINRDIILVKKIA